MLDTIPGVGRTAAEQIVAEIGTEGGQFASAAHLASWAKVCPGNNESAGKRRSGRTGQGNRWLRRRAGASGVGGGEGQGLAASGRVSPLVGRRGAKRAILAVAHRILAAAYYILRERVPYRAPAARPADAQRTARVLKRMLTRIEQSGL